MNFVQSALKPILLLSVALSPLSHQTPALANVFSGEASWYGPGLFGNIMANGKVLTRATRGIAHRYLPMGTLVRVTNLLNNRTITAKVVDRGPYNHRVIDVTQASAEDLGLLRTDLAPVRVRVLN